MSRTYSAGIVTAYGSALAGGYTGTYQEFCEALGDLANVLTEFENFSVTVSTLPAGSSATASYDNGVLSLGIPKGDKGDKGNTGDTGATGNGIVNIVKTGTAGLVDTYTINYTNGGQATFTVTNGEKGDTGNTGNGIVSITKTSTSGNVDTYTVLYTNGNTDTITVTNGSVTSVNGLTGDVVLSPSNIEYEGESLADVLDNKANIDGYYEDLTSGNAEQLISSITENDQVPYNFRTSGGALDIGNRETDTVIGCSYAWNQLVVNGNFNGSTGWVAQSADSTLSVSNNTATIKYNTGTVSVYNPALGMSTSIDVIEGHKYLISFEAYISRGYDVYARTTGFSNNGYVTFPCPNATWTKCQKVLNAVATGSGLSYFGVYNGIADIVANDYLSFRNMMCIDLTIMFGSSIADYIYTLESNNAGDGVEWFRKLFPKPYYAYNVGSLESVNTSAHKMRGYNAWDEEWELGGIDNSGQPTPSTSSIRAKNYIPILPNTSYYVSGLPNGIFKPAYYDANKNFISMGNWQGGSTNNPQTTPSNAYFLRFGMASAYGTTYNHDICVSLYWDGERAGEYEAYDEHSYALDSSLTLRGIPKLDADNNLYCDGDVYHSDGTVDRIWDEIDMGDIDWSYDSDAGLFYKTIASVKTGYANNAPIEFLRCAKYVNAPTPGSGSVSSDKTIGTGTSGGLSSANILIRDSAYTDATTFKTAMSGVKLAFIKATPTTESADPYTNPQIVDNWGTEEYVDYAETQGTRDVAIPVGHSTEYPLSLKDKLETLPNVPDGDGSYLLKQESGVNSYIQYVSPIPSAPSEDGTYVLKATVSGGVATLSWESE